MLNTDVHTAGPTGSWLVSPVLLMFLIFVLFSALLDFLFALKAEFLLLLNQFQLPPPMHTTHTQHCLENCKLIVIKLFYNITTVV